MYLNKSFLSCYVPKIYNVWSGIGAQKYMFRQDHKINILNWRGEPWPHDIAKGQVEQANVPTKLHNSFVTFKLD